MDAPLLILYGSQTGNAQDVAERLGREAELLLFRPHVLAMDAFDVTLLPTERLVLLVASTTGQGEPPGNMRRFWRFLLRKSLPPGSLAHVRCAVFGLGDSGYPLFNATAKKLSRRLEALGAQLLLPTGLGDDQHPSGYEAELDAWASAMWPRMRAKAGPLPPGTPTPSLTASTVLRLGRPKFHVTFLPASSSDPSAAPAAGSWEAAVRAGAAFRRVAAAAAGAAQPADEDGGEAAGHGPQRPYMARLLANRRITAPAHFQDTRHVELDLQGSGMAYDPGDVLAVLPRTPPGDVEALLARLRLDGDRRVRVELYDPQRHGAAAGEGAHGDGGGAAGNGHVADVEARGGGVEAGAWCEATVQDLVQGALDVAGASPRRYFFQVLSFFTDEPLHKERLTYFATAEGRDDLYTYCKREGRTVLEVLQDFPSAAPPLHRLLEACPPLLPRLFSISSSHRLHPGRAHLTVALVEYRTPFKRLKRGLCSTYLASLQPSAPPTPLPPPTSAEPHAPANPHANGAVAPDAMKQPLQGLGERVACWVERGTLRMPQDLSTPLVLIGPGTGVAPFRAMLQERLALLQQHFPPQPPHPAPPPTAAAAAVDPAAAAWLEEQRQWPRTPSGQPVAPCCLYFGCRDPEADFYYREEWEGLQRACVLGAAPEGLVVAFSRQPGQPKAYVTHRLREHGAHLWRLLDTRGACVLVSGSAKKMPADVAAALRDVCQEHGGLGKEEAAAYVRRLELTGRYLVEAWS